MQLSECSIIAINEDEFKRLSDFIQKSYGIDLTKKKQFIISRLSQTLRAMGYNNFNSFLDEVFASKDGKLLELVLNKLTTNYTFFMREKEHFEYLKNKMLPEMEQKYALKKSISIWSAGCSSGEEPYTMSIYLKEYFDGLPGNWDTKILATDISQAALANAKRGTYKRPADIDDELLKKYFTENRDTGLFTVKPQLRSNVIYKYFNLMEPIAFKRKFDIIFCRNVMIYFNQDTRGALIERFHGALEDGGYFVTSHSEPLRDSVHFEQVSPAVYKKK